MESLGELIRLRSPEGIPYDEAVQLLLWVYSSVDILPQRLRDQVWDRPSLIEAFERMGNESLIQCGESECSLDREWWSSVMDEFLGGNLHLDETFPARLGRYLE